MTGLRPLRDLLDLLRPYRVIRRRVRANLQRQQPSVLLGQPLPRAAENVKTRPSWGRVVYAWTISPEPTSPIGGAWDES